MVCIYQSFLIRIWINKSAEGYIWCAKLEDPHTREIFSFQTPEQLLEFLRSLSEKEQPTETTI